MDTYLLDILLIDALKAGYKDFRKSLADRDEFDSFLERFELETEEVKGLKATDADKFKKHVLDHDIDVFQGYPIHETTKYPCHTVIPMSGSEETKHIGNVMGWRYRFTEYDAEGVPLYAKQQYELGSHWSGAIAVTTWSENPTLTLLLHAFAKKALFEKQEIIGAKIGQVKFTEENFEIDKEQYPTIPFVRGLMVAPDMPVAFWQKEQMAFLRRRSTIKRVFS